MGEFNVNKSDGSLDPTAGMPATYPAEQVMMSDGVTSVKDRLDELTTKVPTPPSSNGTYKLTCVVSSGVATYSWVSV